MKGVRPARIHRTNRREKERIKCYIKFVKGMLDNLPQEERQLIEPVFLKYAHLFHDDETNDFKGTNIIEKDIPVGDARPLLRLT